DLELSRPKSAQVIEILVGVILDPIGRRLLTEPMDPVLADLEHRRVRIGDLDSVAGSLVTLSEKQGHEITEGRFGGEAGKSSMSVVISRLTECFESCAINPRGLLARSSPGGGVAILDLWIGQVPNPVEDRRLGEREAIGDLEQRELLLDPKLSSLL